MTLQRMDDGIYIREQINNLFDAVNKLAEMQVEIIHDLQPLCFCTAYYQLTKTFVA